MGAAWNRKEGFVSLNKQAKTSRTCAVFAFHLQRHEVRRTVVKLHIHGALLVTGTSVGPWN